MLSFEKSTSLNRSTHPGQHGGANLSSLSKVRKHNRGKYKRNGGSSPVSQRNKQCCKERVEHIRIHSECPLQMMSVALSWTSVPRRLVELPSMTQPLSARSKAARTLARNSSGGTGTQPGFHRKVSSEMNGTPRIPASSFPTVVYFALKAFMGSALPVASEVRTLPDPVA